MLTVRRTIPSRVTTRLISSSGGGCELASEALVGAPPACEGVPAVGVSLVGGFAGSVPRATGAGDSTAAVCNGFSDRVADAIAIPEVSERNKCAATQANIRGLF